MNKNKDVDKTRKNVIYLALAFAFGILFFGLLFGFILYEYQTGVADKEIANLKVRTQEVALFSNFLENDLKTGNVDCNFYSESLNDYSKYLNEYGNILQKYYENPENIAKVKYLQGDFVTAALNLYLSMEKYNVQCSSQKKNLILYFYPYNCGVCGGITEKINNLVSDVNGTFSFSIPAEIGLESVNFVMNKYGAKTIPSVVVNDNTIEGPGAFETMEEYLYK